VIQARYRAGIATILDVLTSQTALVPADLAFVSARFTYNRRASLERCWDETIRTGTYVDRRSRLATPIRSCARHPRVHRGLSRSDDAGDIFPTIRCRARRSGSNRDVPRRDGAAVVTIVDVYSAPSTTSSTSSRSRRRRRVIKVFPPTRTSRRHVRSYRGSRATRGLPRDHAAHHLRQRHRRTDPPDGGGLETMSQLPERLRIQLRAPPGFATAQGSTIPFPYGRRPADQCRSRPVGSMRRLSHRT